MAKFVSFDIPCNVSDMYDFCTTLVFIDDEVNDTEICLKATSRFIKPNHVHFTDISIGYFGSEYKEIYNIDHLMTTGDLGIMLEDLVNNEELVDYACGMLTGQIKDEAHQNKISKWIDVWIEEHDAAKEKNLIPEKLKQDIAHKLIEAEKNGTIDDYTK